MIRAYGRMVLAGLTAITVVSCSNELAPGGGTRADSTAVSAPGLRLTTGPTGGHVDFCYGFDPNCSSLVHPAEGSPYLFDAHPGPDLQLDPLTYVFPSGATNMLIRLQGSLPCTGTHGAATAFDASGASLGEFPFQIDDPSDCGDDDLTGRASVFVSTSRPVAKVVIASPSPMSYLMPEHYRINYGYPPGTLIYGGELRPNFSFDWTMVPPAQIPTLAVSDSVVTPVLIQVFDAVAGSARNSRRAGATEQPRVDTVSITLKVDTARGPAPQAPFWLETAVQPGSGYHSHDHSTRPKGRLWPASEAAASALGPGGDTVLKVLIPSSGALRVLYRSSGISGVEVIRLRKDSASGPVLDSAVVTVKLDGLVRMARELAGQYVFKGQDSTVRGQGHGNSNDGVTPSFRDSVIAVFADYMRDSINGTPTGFLRGQTTFVITDASLPWGGLLDIAETPARAWRWPHFTHRAGTDMDIRTHDPQPADSAHQELTATMDSTRRARFIKLCAGRLSCRFETPYETGNPYHIHLKPAAAPRSETH